jgi:DUF971 family protein
VDVEFEDGAVASFTLVELRQHCPCAGCRNAREEGRPPYRGDEASLRIDDAELTGAWGLRIVWQDGHGTGIFPWERLRAWSESGQFSLPPDSGFGR